MLKSDGPLSNRKNKDNVPAQSIKIMTGSPTKHPARERTKKYFFTVSLFGVKAGRAKRTGYTQAMATRNPIGNEHVVGLYLFRSLLRAVASLYQSPQLSKGTQASRFEPRVRPPQAAEERSHTRTQFSRPLTQSPRPLFEQARPRSCP